MSKDPAFDLKDFMPYLLNAAAETASYEFAQIYKKKYGMLRTEWRVVFHLGRYGPLTAKAICDMARVHKTKVSRAVSALEAKSLLSRETLADDRRHEVLTLTRKGRRVFDDLYNEAQAFDAHIMRDFTAEESQQMRAMLIKMAGL